VCANEGVCTCLVPLALVTKDKTQEVENSPFKMTKKLVHRREQSVSCRVNYIVLSLRNRVLSLKKSVDKPQTRTPAGLLS